MSDAAADRARIERWRDRQAALAAFSLHALRSRDLDAILQEACSLVARGLRLPIAKVLQALPNENALLVRAAVGLPPDLVALGETRVPGEKRSAAGYALLVDEPVVSEIETETRFQISEIVRRANVKVSLNVAIPTEAGPFGTLEVDSLENRPFSAEDIDFLRIYAGLLGAAVERQRSGTKLATLMRELQHRVKNDLQVVTALLMLESRQAANIETRARLQSVASRVDSLRLVHERLFVSGRVEAIDLGGYLRELCLARFRMHGIDPEGDIKLALDLAAIETDSDRAVSLGLIANEFLTNSLKHAFPMGRGLISIVLDQPEPHLLRLVLSDNGIGMPAAREERASGMGLRLIGMMSEQIGAAAAWSNGGGSRLILTLPLG